MRSRSYWVYILANERNTVLYTGVTGDLAKRVSEHKQGIVSGFTKKYNAHKLVFCEEFSDPLEAVAAEKKIKAGSRRKKEILIERTNPHWDELMLV